MTLTCAFSTASKIGKLVKCLSSPSHVERKRGLQEENISGDTRWCIAEEKKQDKPSSWESLHELWQKAAEVLANIQVLFHLYMHWSGIRTCCFKFTFVFFFFFLWKSRNTSFWNPVMAAGSSLRLSRTGKIRAWTAWHQPQDEISLCPPWSTETCYYTTLVCIF